MPNENKSRRKLIIMLAVALLVILMGNLMAYMTQTDWGNVEVRDVRFEGTNGLTMSALLYVPKDVTAENPAPGILAIHGYINSRETQDGFAIEFARRGYVVLAIDQTGHGYLTRRLLKTSSVAPMVCATCAASISLTKITLVSRGTQWAVGHPSSRRKSSRMAIRPLYWRGLASAV